MKMSGVFEGMAGGASWAGQAHAPTAGMWDARGASHSFYADSLL